MTPISTATNTAGTPNPVQQAGPFAIAITPDGTTAYVADFGSYSVTPIDIAANSAGTAIPVGYEPAGIVISPDGLTVYVNSLVRDGIMPGTARLR